MDFRLFCCLEDILLQSETNARFGLPLHEGIELFCEENGWVQANSIEEVRESKRCRIRPPEVMRLLVGDAGKTVVVPRPVDLVRLRTQFSIYSTLYIVIGGQVEAIRFTNLLTDIRVEDVVVFITERDAYDWLYWSSQY